MIPGRENLMIDELKVYTKSLLRILSGFLFAVSLIGCSPSESEQEQAAAESPQQIEPVETLTAALHPESEQVASGSIHGTVTAEAGQVIGFRVKAKLPVANMTWNVFTRNGRFRVPDLTPGSYEVWVAQNGFESPVKTVKIKAGDTAEVNIHVTVRESFDLNNQFRPRDSHVMGARRDAVELVSYDELYPPGPGRDALEYHCSNCHGTWFHHMRNSREGWEFWVKNMIDRRSIPNSPNRNIIYTRENFPDADAKQVIDYLAENFAPDVPYRDLLLDELIPNEEVIADAIFIEYDVPVPEGFKKRSYHDPYIASDGGIWANDRRNRSFVHIDPDARDAGKMIIEEYQAPWETTSMHGITIDTRNRVYYADVNGGWLGELDLNTGEWKRYPVNDNPESDDSMIQIVVDSKDNIWGGLIGSTQLAKLDAGTREIALWPFPTPDINSYGLIASRDDKIWTAGISRHMIVRFDPVTEEFTEYRTPTIPSAPRRLGEDKSGNIWWAEYVGGHLGMLNPETGEMKQYRYPLAHSRGYDSWPVGDYIWSTEATYETLVRFDPETEQFVYYPIPLSQPSGNPGVPKMENEADGTIWFAYRGVRDGPNPLVAFKPWGNADK